MRDVDLILSGLGAEVSPSVAVTLCMRYEDDVREGVVRCFEDYATRFGQYLTWFVEDDTGRFRKYDASRLAYPRVRLLGSSQKLEGDDVIWAAGGAKHRHASPWQFYCDVSGGYPPALHYVRAACDVATFEGRWADYVAMVEQWAEWLRVWHGYAGYSLNVSEAEDHGQHDQILCALASRFAGIELDYATSVTSSTADGIKGVNWLTLVSNELLGRVGGAASLRPRLSADVGVRPIRDGILFQAGAQPELGDTNRGERLPLYRDVARLLKPLRARDVWSIRFDKAGTRDWLERFDD